MIVFSPLNVLQTYFFLSIILKEQVDEVIHCEPLPKIPPLKSTKWHEPIYILLLKIIRKFLSLLTSWSLFNMLSLSQALTACEVIDKLGNYMNM